MSFTAVRRSDHLRAGGETPFPQNCVVSGARWYLISTAAGSAERLGCSRIEAMNLTSADWRSS